MFVEQLSPQIQSIINHDLLLRCQAVSDELLDMAYIWTHNNMPLLNSNSELSGHIVSFSLNVTYIMNFIFLIPKYNLNNYCFIIYKVTYFQFNKLNNFVLTLTNLLVFLFVFINNHIYL